MTQHSKWGSIIAALSIAFICVATLTPGTPPPAQELPPPCRGWCEDSLIADFARNILLFLPLGFGLRFAGVRARRSILVGTCLSALVEILQIRIIVGRDASVLDWISNSSGTIAGVLIAAHLGALVRPRPRGAAALAVVAVTVWIGTLLLGAWGIQPAPTRYPYWGQRAPQFEEVTPFRGEVLSGRVNGVEVQSARMVHDDTVRAPLDAGYLRVDAVVRAGPKPRGSDIAPIIRVADGARNEILMLGQGGNHLVLRYRLHATALRLETPAFALEGAFPTITRGSRDSTSAPVTLTAVVDRGRVRLSARDDRGTKTREFELSSAVAWSFFLPWDYWFGPNAVWISQLWLGGLLFPAGYWIAMTKSRPQPLLAIVLSAVIGTLLAIPLVFALPRTQVSQLVSAVAGLALGGAVARVVLRNPGDP